MKSGRSTRSSHPNSPTNAANLDPQQLFEKLKKEITIVIQNEFRSVSEKLSSLEKKMDNIEHTVILLRNKQEVQEKEVVRLSQELHCLQRDLPDELMHEIELRMKKRKNVIVSGIPESRAGNVDERKNCDEREMMKLFDTIDLTPNISDVIRLGKISERGHRILRVTFAKEEERNHVLRRARLLSKYNDYKNVYLQPDRTPYELQQHSKLRQELKERRDSGEDVIIYKNQIINRNDVNNKQNFQ